MVDRDEQEPALDSDGLTTASGRSERPARHIGDYRVLRKLGEGGMGEVYEALQEQPVRRKVAVKVIKLGMDTRSVVARFESERQALALMSHPTIARVLDAGTTERGRPYFVMEFVRGVPITEYCDNHRLGTVERLQLFIQVCEGVQHAHQKGIIHRDIKSTNILVEEFDDRPVPKIIDFGVAKAVSQPLTERTLHTELGQLVGTPEYMSPEQADLSGFDVDTRTDVYSLGVVLYELLTGSLPFPSSDLRETSVPELCRKIREDEPPRPSTRCRTLVGDSSDAARNRRTEPGALVKLLRGDLDWITMKALEKDRARRYSSASELALDLRRHLRNEPVLAGPPSTWYRMGKFVRRNRLGVVAASLIVLALILGAVGSSVGMLRALRAEKQAREEAETAKQVSDFLVDLFRVSDPGQARGNSITAREILDEGAEKVELELRDQPVVQTRMMETMGLVYQNLGLYDRAEELLKRTIEIRRRELGDADVTVGRALSSLGWMYTFQWRHEEAEEASREALKILEAELPPDHPEIARGLTILGTALRVRGELDQAQVYLERALTIYEATVGPDDFQTSYPLYHLGWLHKLKGNYETSRDYYERTLTILVDEVGDDHPYTAWCLNDLAVVYGDLGDNERSRQFYERSLAAHVKIHGEDHPALAAPLNNLGVFHWNEGELDLAGQYYSRALELREKAFGPDNPQVASSLNNLALLHQRRGDHDEALALYQRALAINERALGPRTAGVAQNLHNLGTLYFEMGDYEKARATEEKAMGVYEQTLGPEHPDVAPALIDLGTLYRVTGEYEKAGELLERALRIQVDTHGTESAAAAGCRLRLAKLHAARGDRETAERYYREAGRTFEANSLLDDPAVIYRQAGYHALLGDRDRALDLLQRALDLGYREAIDRGYDLESLRGDPEFEALASIARERER